MNGLALRIAEHVKENGVRYSISTPLKETDPFRAEDGSLWKNWRHTGDLTVWIGGKRYHAYCEHDLPKAWGVVLADIAGDLGL